MCFLLERKRDTSQIKNPKAPDLRKPLSYLSACCPSLRVTVAAGQQGRAADSEPPALLTADRLCAHAARLAPRGAATGLSAVTGLFPRHQGLNAPAGPSPAARASLPRPPAPPRLPPQLLVTLAPSRPSPKATPAPGHPANARTARAQQGGEAGSWGQTPGPDHVLNQLPSGPVNHTAASSPSFCPRRTIERAYESCHHIMPLPLLSPVQNENLLQAALSTWDKSQTPPLA